MCWNIIGLSCTGFRSKVHDDLGFGFDNRLCDGIDLENITKSETHACLFQLGGCFLRIRVNLGLEVIKHGHRVTYATQGERQALANKTSASCN